MDRAGCPAVNGIEPRKSVTDGTPEALGRAEGNTGQYVMGERVRAPGVEDPIAFDNLS